MQLCSLQPSQISLPTNNLAQLHFQRWCLFGQFKRFSNSKRYPGFRKLQFSHIAAQLSSGVPRFSSSAVEAAQESVDLKDDNTVFVAGATGRVGSRTVRELLKMGFQVRAGVRSAQRAESLVQSVKEMKLDVEDKNGVKPIEKLQIVECDLEARDQIIPALGNASVVLCCIGASEKEIFDVIGPYRIDYQATKNLIDAASDAKVKHFILLTSLGTNKIGFPAAILNLFWGVLLWKRKAEEALIASGLPYTIVRPGGMERPTDSYKETHNLVLSQEDTLFGGQVSNLQVAELMAFMAQNRDLSYCKIVEVIAETTAPLTPMDKLLVKIPSARDDMYKVEVKEMASLDTKPGTSDVPTSIPRPDADTFDSAAVISQKMRPLSPYTAYEDLKPPSSPSPSPPGSDQDESAKTLNPPSSPTSSAPNGPDADTIESAAVTSPKMRHLSPYTAYEDLKPPSSPSPSPPGNKRDESVKTLNAVDGVPKVIDGISTENDPRESTFYHSPFPVYEDLRPPTSPTPTAPSSVNKTLTSTESQPVAANSSTEDGLEPVEAQNTMDEQNPIEPKPRPLSPYTMYYDLKPPSSPMPSPKNH